MTAIGGCSSLSFHVSGSGANAAAAPAAPASDLFSAQALGSPDFADRLVASMDQVAAGVAELTTTVMDLKAKVDARSTGGGPSAGCPRCDASSGARGANAGPEPAGAAVAGAMLTAGGPADADEPDDDRDDEPEAAEEARAPAPASGSVRSRIVQIARAEVGVREEGGEDRGERIKTFRTAVRGPGENPSAAEAWCADFASWVTRQAGAPIGTGGVGYDYVPQIVDWAKGSGRWRSASQGPSGPGDLVIYSYRGKRPDHVAIVVEPRGSSLRTIGGNESDAVREQTVSTRSVIGYVRVA